MEITVQELIIRLEKRDIPLFLDIREEWEYEEYNIGALNFPFYNMPNRMQEIESYKDQEVVLHCKSGNRGGKACKLMRQYGFTNPRNLIGGIDAFQLELASK